MLSGHFYHQTTKRIVAAFGSLFNNIVVARKETSGLSNVTRVPIAYAARAKWLTRINEEDELIKPTQVAIRLPRMSFEITSMSPDDSKRVSPLNKFSASTDGGGSVLLRQATPYRIGMQLNIIAKLQDDILQIFEQIIPYFNPSYNLSVFGLDGVNHSIDVPVTLQSVGIQDDFEGDLNTRRTLIYTLDFDLRVTYYGPTIDVSGGKGLIRTTNVHFSDLDKNYLETITTGVADPADTKESHTVTVKTTQFIPDSTDYTLTLTSVDGTFQVGEVIVSTLTATYGTVSSVSGSTLEVTATDGVLIPDEYVIGRTSKAVGKIVSAS